MLYDIALLRNEGRSLLSVGCSGVESYSNWNAMKQKVV